uniref:Protein naked cuticle homolog n=1 Tax=Triatoma infestans TaxID=30076 RepID=A0A023EWY7_TRIIF
MNKAQMALLVRWWKQKFLSGYKQFSAVLADEEKYSDTEQLIKTCPEGYTNWTSDRETLASSTPSPTSRLNLQELQCGISVNENCATSHRDRQEFSFTLYDFDGRGKITKDDIAGLVTTIYETVGSSIKVPQYGSKTIKVKLTVSPGRGVRNTSTRSDRNGSAHSGDIRSPTIDNHRRETRRAHVSGKRSRRQNERTAAISQRRRRESPASSAGTDERHGRLSDIEDGQTHPRLSPSLCQQHHNTLQTGTALNCGCCGRAKKRSSSLQRQELLKIIQANMDKNNLSFQTSRKHNLWSQQNKDKSTAPLFPYLSKTKNQSTSPLQSATSHNHTQPTYTVHLAKTPSSHQHKHRHREAEQARAMAQVVKWLEQEFSTKSKTNENIGQSKTGCSAAGEANTGCASTPARQEHHHVHEHVHHHYHHYTDSALSV